MEWIHLIHENLKIIAPVDHLRCQVFGLLEKIGGKTTFQIVNIDGDTVADVRNNFLFPFVFWFINIVIFSKIIN